MLSTHYPGLYSEGSGVPWLVLPEDLFQFLFSTRSKNTIRIILALLQARDYSDPSWLVWRRDATMREVTGIHGYSWLRSLAAEDLRDLVDIERGVGDVKGRTGTATRYDLSPLVIALKNWRQRGPKKPPVQPTDVPF